ncbi:MAG: Eco57I restriction-modification methylase domain-containing protein, partial [Thermodesulfobacteriota bacterium]
MSNYIYHSDLFNGSYFRRVLADASFPRERKVEDAARRLKKMLDLWNDVRDRLVQDLPETKALETPYVGLPPTVTPMRTAQEAEVENDWIRKVLDEVLEYVCTPQKSLALDGLSDKEQKTNKNRRPDWILFREKRLLNNARKIAEKKKKTISAMAFCRDADFILDAKRFSKGVGADEEKEDDAKSRRGKKNRDTSAAEDIDQVERYLRGSGMIWGILTNGRSWRLMRAGKKQEHLRFDLVLFLEDLRRNGRKKASDFTDEDLAEFALFYYFFGPPAVGGGYLDQLYREGEANTRRVSEILRENAHRAVQMIAVGFWKHPDNEYPEKVSQGRLDHLRELALTFLYRLLFILKAEAQGLLPMRAESGADTKYAKHASTWAIFHAIRESHDSEGTLASIDRGFRQLKDLFGMVNEGNKNYEVPAYNGGLFDPEFHQELESLRLNDDVVFSILGSLIYLDENEPVPYADLDVRDFGDIYEGLLEQRLVQERIGDGYCLTLRNKKGERKASGSYFTPDSLVEHLVRETVTPLLESCKNDPHRILALRVVDPAMGSGHFLVKVVDNMAWYLTLNCAPIDKDVPDDNGPNEYAYWKRLVVENCVFGVDVNPMAVELAKVALWLHTASKGKPLSFLNHHLKFGNSLIGADLRDVARPGLMSKAFKSKVVWVPRPMERESIPKAKKTKTKKRVSKQLELPFEVNTNLFSGILESVTTILRRPSSTPNDVKSKRREYETLVEQKLKIHRVLCDLWCAQWFMAEPDKEGLSVYEGVNGLYVRVKKACGLMDENAKTEAVDQLMNQPFVRKIEQERNEGYGPRPMRFFHWQLEFPEVAFTPEGEMKDTFGFDAVVGNPPWDKIKPAKRDFYGPFSEEVANRQGTSLNALIADLEKETPELADGWNRYEKAINDTTTFLSQCNLYQHQVTEVDGKRTGGDPDLFRYFTERAAQCAGSVGRVGFLVPCTLWQGQGCTALRMLLFERCTLHSIYTFENYRKWAFDIDSRFKFTAFVFSNDPPAKTHSFPAAFMLRDTQVLEGRMTERVIQLSAGDVKAVSPFSLALIDNKSDGEARFIGKIHKAHPALGSKESGWEPVYRRELDMSNDSWRV